MSTDQNRKSGLTRKRLKRGSKWITKKGPLTTLWDDFRAKKLAREKNRDGVIVCQDWRVGLPACNTASGSPDLHHILGREARPDLYFADKNLVWLVRNCHDQIHNNTSGPSAKAQDDPKRPLEATPQRDAILGVQGRSAQGNTGNARRTVYSSVQHRNADLLERKKEGVV